MYARCQPRNLWWDDYTICGAMVLSFASFAVTIAAMTVGYGRHIEHVSKTDFVTFSHLMFINQPLWVLEVTLVKISVAFMLLRIRRTRGWRIAMWVTIAYLTVNAVVVIAFQFTECRPLSFYWNRSLTGGVCRSPKVVQICVIVTSVVFIFSDVQSSLLPLTFIFTLNRPLRERVALSVLMGMGLLASIVGSLKLIGIGTLHRNPDPTWNNVPVKVGSFAEACLGLIAACMPPLKARGERWLRRAGAAMSEVVRRSTGSQNTLLMRSKTIARPKEETYDQVVSVTESEKGILEACEKGSVVVVERDLLGSKDERIGPD
ncbi:hypothetical protein EJ06DRAFT_483764 [Trichodelitschia bisporula]|uniref:Rhodopsin domain-containing protein n=1 Tax=Trichodelitschia bisporula TaxID=703511 RepID=A0A6G1HKA9_9PEZI|nr:hypothetical protein EJ06DRAFT_483764 [Trichodelitschia bisporula]